ncbi:MerR HTH family regulatory protein [Gemmobacter aquatilis]|uniref:MerR HTH family regulatory protein n=2 Tax=Gemmobacter aquatilis TaxID=933059 RepID=A0A1H8BF73_9RHOB|nr:MerR family transcriptional regulator [Gemmobacter aquatilis]SEM80648.1 MerR HTH family regulatory protein [Gemmobacter aquatilis]
MDKSPDAFRTISEVADLLETPAHVLRFWESRFPQIKPVKRAGGRRYYRPVDVALISGIRRLLHDEGMTIRGVQKILREQGVRFVSGLADASDEDLHAASDADFIEAEEHAAPDTPEADPPAEVVSLAGWRAQPSSGSSDTAPARQTSLFDLPPFVAPALPEAMATQPDRPPLAEIGAVPPGDEGQPPDGISPAAVDELSAAATSAEDVSIPPAPPLVDSSQDAPHGEPVPKDEVHASVEDSPGAVPAPARVESAPPEPPAPLVWIPTRIRALSAADRAVLAAALAPLTQRLKALHRRLDDARGPRRR